MRIADLFHPTSADDFLLDYFGQQALHTAGSAERFARFANPASADELAWSLERELEAPIVAETARNAPEPQRGAHDLIVLQIAGATQWKTYGKDASAAAAEPDGAFVLEPGAGFYLPRAFWRSTHVEASSEPGNGVPPQASRALVFHIQNPTGADLIDWMTAKIKEAEIYQADIPRFASPAVQAAHLAELRKTFGNFFRSPSLLQNYSRRLNRLAPSHAAHGHPWTGTVSSGEVIALATPRTPRVFRSDCETIHLFVAGREIHFPEDAAPLLQYVLDRAPVSVADFYIEFEGEFDRDELSSFLEALSGDGVITVLEPAFL